MCTEGPCGVRTPAQPSSSTQKDDDQDDLEINERLLAHHNERILGDIALPPYLDLLVASINHEEVEKRIVDKVMAL
jgi:hypothetical protein